MRVPTVVAVARWRRGGDVSESTHPVTTTLLNYQLSLAEAVRRSNRGITTLLQDLDKVESESYGALPRTLDLGAYELLTGQITRFAMDKIAQD